MTVATPTPESMSLMELHAAVEARWQQTPELVHEIPNMLYWRDSDENSTPYLGYTFLSWALTASLSDVILWCASTTPAPFERK